MLYSAGQLYLKLFDYMSWLPIHMSWLPTHTFAELWPVRILRTVWTWVLTRWD